jgi:putative FmdB family regulatory protein
MPLYDYDCAACGRRFEAIHGLHADPPTVCPLCGSGPVRKAIGAPAVHYKGSGWAKKERRAKPATTTSASGDGSEGSSDSSAGEAASTTKETKPTTPRNGSTGSTPPSPSTAKPD